MTLAELENAKAESLKEIAAAADAAKQQEEQAAREAERAAVRAGDRNFKGVGF